MSFIRVQAPPARGSAKAGVSFSLVARKDGSVVALLTLTAPWQERFLGGPVAGRRFEVLHGRGDDEGLLSIVALNANATDRACAGEIFARGMNGDCTPAAAETVMVSPVIGGRA